MSTERERLEELTERRRQELHQKNVDQLVAAGAILIERTGEIAVEFERGGHLHVLVTPHPALWSHMRLLYLPVARTLMMVDYNGVRSMVTQVVSMRQAVGGVDEQTWTIDFGPRGAT